MSIVELWMIIIGITMGIANIPQIVRLYRRKTSADLSLSTWSVIFNGQINWILYGFYINNMNVVFTNVFGGFGVLTIILLILKYRKKIEV